MEEGVRAAIVPRLSQPVQLGHFVLVVAVTVGGGVWTLSQAFADLGEEMQGIRIEIQETRLETQLEFQDTRLEIQDARIETRDLINDLRKELRAEIAEVRSDLSGQIASLRREPAIPGEPLGPRDRTRSSCFVRHPASSKGRNVSTSSAAGSARTPSASLYRSVPACTTSS